MRYRIITILFSCLLITSFGFTQEVGTWKILSGKKVILAGVDEDSSKNTILLKKADLSNNNFFKIEFTEPKNSVTKGWVRTVALMDTVSTVIVQRDSTSSIQLYNRDMLKILWSRKKVHIYTWAAPADPGMAAAVRIKRILLSTLVLAD